MKVSIIVPVYNTEKYLSECLDSLVGQTYKDIEILVIDDGSTDSSLDIAKKYAERDNRIKILQSSHQGANRARGLGVKKSTGDYCMFIDSDDWIELNAVEKILTVLKAHDCDIVKFNGQIEPGGILKNEHKLSKRYQIMPIYEARKLLLETNTLNNLCFQIYRKTLFKDMKSFSKKISNCEDFLVNLELYDKAQKIIFVKDILYHYRQNVESTTKKATFLQKKTNLQDMLVAFNGAEFYGSRWNMEKNSVLRNFYLRALDMFRSTLFSARLSRQEFIKLSSQVFSDEFFKNLRLKISNKALNQLLRNKSLIYRLKHSREVKLIYYGEYKKLYLRYRLFYHHKSESDSISKYMHGRLGNQFFQYATLRQIQEINGGTSTLKLNFSKCIYSKGFDDELKCFNVLPYQEVSKIYFLPRQLFSVVAHKIIKRLYRFVNQSEYYKFRANFEINTSKKLQKIGIYWKEDGALNITPTKASQKIVIGHFESERNFGQIREQLLTELTPKKPPLEKNAELYKVAAETNSVCVSVRRGDFVSNPKLEKKFNVCGPGYFEKAVKEIKKHVENPTFIIFSDDIDWCRQKLKINGKVYYEDGTDPVWEKLRLMYSCKHFIISNSTFSWWAQYLSRNDKKVVIAPMLWQKTGYNEDIYDDSWILIDNRSEK